MSWLRRIAVTVLLAGIPAANAAPLVPPGDQPGRERYRFTPSPLDRFMQPAPPERPLLSVLALDAALRSLAEEAVPPDMRRMKQAA